MHARNTCHNIAAAVSQKCVFASRWRKGKRIVLSSKKAPLLEQVVTKLPQRQLQYEGLLGKTVKISDKIKSTGQMYFLRLLNAWTS